MNKKRVHVYDFTMYTKLKEGKSQIMVQDINFKHNDENAAHEMFSLQTLLNAN